MGGLRDRRNDRSPSGLMQPRAQLDVFVIHEKSRIEHAIAQRRAAVESCRRRNAPSLRKRAANRKSVADLSKCAAADVDACSVDRSLIAPDDCLYGGVL